MDTWLFHCHELLRPPERTGLATVQTENRLDVTSMFERFCISHSKNVKNEI